MSRRWAICPELYTMVLWGIASAAQAYPTAINVIPVADVAGNGALTVQLEADGNALPFSRGASHWLLTSCGIGDRLEVGLDRVESPDESRWFMDAKLQILPGAPRRPAIALGATDVTRRGEDAAWYVVVTKDLGSVRTTIGYQRDDAHRLLIGGVRGLTSAYDLQADFTSGPGGQATVGLCRDLGHDRYALLYWAHSNTSADGGFSVGLNLSWDCQWK